MNIASIKVFILGLLIGIIGSYIFNIPSVEDSFEEDRANNFLVNQNYENKQIPDQEKIKIPADQPPDKNLSIRETKKEHSSTCDVFTRDRMADINFKLEFDKLQKFFPEQDLNTLAEQELKETLIDSVLDSSKNNEQRIESLAALKLLDGNPLSSELVDQVISDLPKFIAENDSPSAVEALMLIEDDVQEYQFYQLLELNQSEDIDIRMATIFAIANADPYRQNKHVFDQLYKHDKSQMVRDTAYNILKNEYSDK